MPRIVTLMPSFAEDVCAIGAAAQLAGVSAYSNDVPCARGLPEVNNFSSLNAERIVQLHPDVVIALRSQRGMAAPLERAHVRVVYLSDDSYDDIFTGIAAIGTLSRHEQQARGLIASLRAQTKALQAKAHYRRTPRVLFVEQALPLWTIGPRSFITTLIELAGGRIVTNDLRQAYAQYSDEAVLRSDPDAIVATADSHLDEVLNREPWRSLRAVREHHVFIIPDSNLLARPGPRYVRGIQWLIARFSSL